MTARGTFQDDAHELVTRLEPGLLKSAMGPFRERIDKILKADHINNVEPARRFRIFGIGVRSCLPEHFRIAASATLQRMRLDIRLPQQIRQLYKPTHHFTPAHHLLQG